MIHTDGAKHFLFSKTIQTSGMFHPTSYLMGTEVLSWEKSGWGMKLTTHILLVLTSRMSEAIPPLLLYAFMA